MLEVGSCLHCKTLKYGFKNVFQVFSCFNFKINLINSVLISFEREAHSGRVLVLRSRASPKLCVAGFAQA